MLVDDIERDINESNKVFFGDVDPLSFLDLDEWLHRVETEGSIHDINQVDKMDSQVNTHINDGSDVDLIPASVTVDLFEALMEKEIDIAYVRDQEGNVLGFDQFVNFKKERRELFERKIQNENLKLGKDESNNEKENVERNDNIRNKKRGDNVGKFTFYIRPDCTKTIQVFVLYKDYSLRDTDGIVEENAITNNGDENDKEVSNITSNGLLYYSRAISLEEIKCLVNKGREGIFPEKN